MKKLLLIGNSFLAALKNSDKFCNFDPSYVGFSQQPDFNVDRYENTPDGDGLQLTVSDSVSYKKNAELWALTVGNLRAVNLNDFSAFIIVGVLRPPNPWGQINHLELTKSLIPGYKPVSFSCYSEIIRNTQGDKIIAAQHIQSVIRKKNKSRPVLFIPSPHIRDDAENFNSKLKIPSFWLNLEDRDKKIIQESEFESYKRVLYNCGIEFYNHPDKLVVNGNRCPAIFSVGALGTSNLSDDAVEPQWGNEDLYHKNAEFGKVWWNELNRVLASL